MRSILVCGAGGAPAANFIRSLRAAPEPFYLVGVDCDRYHLQRAESDERHLVPPCHDQDYLAVLAGLIEETRVRFLHAQADVEVAVLSEARELLPLRTFLPSTATIRLCQDKFRTYERWRAAGLRVPATRRIAAPEELRAAFAEFGPRLWLRASRGAFGLGSLATESFEQARAWLDFQQGWGSFTAAACLTDRSVTWQSLWWEGTLVVAQGRRREYWEFANRAPSGVTGLTGTGVTVADPQVDQIALEAIRAVDSRPHGLYGVDLTYDRDAVPNPTEINIGRFFTTHLFFTRAGLNLPYLYVKLGLEEPVSWPEPRLNPLPPGLAWVRGMDVEPVLTTLAAIEATERELEKRRSR
ncbi:MAG: carboxylate--amine ligase [Deltaproteobacteria bacterium]|nr:carboxylate--amine ligase [Deltaproteobacteria bacterium]